MTTPGISGGKIIFGSGKDITIGFRFNRWPSIIFLIGVTLITVVGCPLYLIYYGIAQQTVILTFVLIFLTTLAITAGYHRLYAHKTYKANRIYQFFMLALGAATFQQSALKWASLHRSHHQYADTDRDPYNITKGFFYAHMGWILFWLRGIDFDNVKDLQKNSLIMHQHRRFRLWAVGFGILLPTLIGFAYHHAIEALLFGVAARLFIVFQVTFFINSYAHSFGTRGFDTLSSARDHWIGAILTGGEGYHNFHHRFPNDYRNGIRWCHWDPSKWFIWICGRMGWVWGLKRTPTHLIAQAKSITS